MITAGKKLTFSEDDLDSIGREVCNIVSDLENQYQDRQKQIQKAWSWYEAEKLSERKDTPWADSSNIVVPLVRIHADATHARYLLLLKSGENIWVGRTSNEEFAKAKLDVEVPRFLNWAAKNEFDFDTPSSDWMLEVITVGDGVLALGWEERTAQVFVPGVKKSQNVVLKRGPVVEHIPRENCLWDTNYRAWEAPVFAKRSKLSWLDLVDLANNHEWDWEVLQSIKGQTTGASWMGSGDVEKDREAREGNDPQSGPQAYGLYDFREVWIEWPLVAKSVGAKPPDELEKGDELGTIVVFLHRDSGKVVKITTKPYMIPDNPFYDAYFKKRPGTNSSPGLAHILRDIQEAMTTFVNQAADSVTKAISVGGVTSDANMVDASFAPNMWPYVDDVNEVKELGTGTMVGPDMVLFSQLNVVAERLTGINDPALGRETRMGGHPAPATSTLSLLSEGKKLDITAIRSMRRAVSKLGLDMATLYQQMEMDDGKVIRAVGREDGAKVLEWMFPQDKPIVGHLELDLATVSETMNPEAERTKAIGIFQVTANYYALVTQYLSLAANPQAPPALAMAMLKGLFALQESYEKILESGDEDDIKAYTLNLEELARGVLRGRSENEGPAQGPQAGAPAGANPRAQGGNGSQIGSGL